MSATQYPDYFQLIPPVRLHDPLAALFGAPADGLVEYRFIDAVRLAGHACPTVAGAWLMTTQGLATLYGEALPQRGDIAVALGDAEECGVTGVIGSIATLITGAAGRGGFKGLAGQHVRQKLLQHGVAGAGTLRLTRRDTGASVDCRFNPAVLPGDPKLGSLLPEILSGHADSASRAEFAHRWQARVRRMLLDHAELPGLLQISPVGEPSGLAA